MLNAVTRTYVHAVTWCASPWAESIMLLFVRIALAGVFWRSGQTKVVEGSWLSVSDGTFALFSEDPFNKVPILPSELAAYVTTYAEHALPLLLVVGLFTRLSALALLGMTLVIQIFVFPDAWWPVHSLWVALSLVLIVRGGGMLSVDALLNRRSA
jgi:putative oxidoreductase